ncbi:MAG: hypothetical protein ACE5IW_08710 [bacterium]
MRFKIKIIYGNIYKLSLEAYNGIPIELEINFAKTSPIKTKIIVAYKIPVADCVERIATVPQIIKPKISGIIKPITTLPTKKMLSEVKADIVFIKSYDRTISQKTKIVKTIIMMRKRTDIMYINEAFLKGFRLSLCLTKYQCPVIIAPTTEPKIMDELIAFVMTMAFSRVL